MLRRLGRSCLHVLDHIGQTMLFFRDVLWVWPRWSQGTLLIQQLYSVGVLSVLVIMVAGLFIGLVLGLQGHIILVKFGAEQALGQLVALGLVRELGPVVSALLFAGRAGSALTAEIGLMKASEQLSSLEMMGVDPLRWIIAPRLWAGVYALPLLTLLFIAIAIYGGYVVGVLWLSVDAGAFWSNMQKAVDFQADVCNGFLKSIVFGWVVTGIAVYQGYYCVATSQGIARATTKTVVHASLAILGLDFILTALMFGGW